MTKIKTRTLVRFISFTLASVIVMGSFAIMGYRAANRYKDDLKYVYDRALNELSDHITNIESTLTKGMYANTSTQQTLLYSKLFSQSESAKSSLAQLPLESYDLFNINKFVSQVGDFSAYVSRKVSQNKKLSTEDFDNLKALQKYANDISTSLRDVYGMYSLDRMADSSKDFLDVFKETSYSIDSGFRDMNEGFTDFPTMIYDGPFSDNITRENPKFLENKPQINEEQAILKVCQFFGVDAEKVYVSGENGGNLQTFNLQVSDLDISVSVSKLGGYITSIIDPRMVGDSFMDYNAAISKAQDFLNKFNMQGMKESYYTISNNICTINFAYEKEGITYYPDLAKVGVALDDGEIISFNSTGYIMNHCERSIDHKFITLEDAQKSVSPLLSVKSSKMACIPGEGLNEVFCYEFNCLSEDNKNIIVYINSATGMEENILILLKYDNGVLTI